MARHSPILPVHELVNDISRTLDRYCHAWMPAEDIGLELAEALALTEHVTRSCLLRIELARLGSRAPAP